MKEWADVYLSSVDERLLVQRCAVFYIPTALNLMAHHDITKSRLSNFAQVYDDKSAGKQAVTKVADCRPTVYDSVTGFISVFNGFCERNDYESRLLPSDIVACVFRFEMLSATLAQLEMSKDDLVKATGIAPLVVESAVGGFRLQLGDCLKIFNSVKDAPNLAGKPLQEVIFVTHKNSRNSIQKTKDDNYVYRREFLKPAPAKGHPWAINE